MKFLPKAFEMGENPKATPSFSRSTMESSLCMKTCAPMEGELGISGIHRGLSSTVRVPFGREKEGKNKQYSSCWPETYVESIRKLTQHGYHMVKAHLLLSLEADSKASSMDGCIYGNIQFKYKPHFLRFFECYR